MIEPTLKELADRAFTNRGMCAVADLGHEPSEGSLGFALRSLHGAMRVLLAPSQRVAAGMDAQLPGARGPLPYRTGHSPIVPWMGKRLGKWQPQRAARSLRPSDQLV